MLHPKSMQPDMLQRKNERQDIRKRIKILLSYFILLKNTNILLYKIQILEIVIIQSPRLYKKHFTLFHLTRVSLPDVDNKFKI